MKIHASLRLLASNVEAGKALTAIKKILNNYSFVTNQEGQEQTVIWRSSLFRASLTLNLDEDTLMFEFRDKGATAGFDAEGTNADSLFKDIRYNVTEFQPVKKMLPEIAELRNQFAHIGI